MSHGKLEVFFWIVLSLDWTFFELGHEAALDSGLEVQRQL